MSDIKYFSLKDLQKQELEKRKINIDHVPARKNNVKKPKIISFWTEKGGVGKTTSCITIGYALAKKGFRVVIYDCDPQRSLSYWCFGKEINVEHNIDLDKFLKKASLNYPNTFYDQIMNNVKLNNNKKLISQTNTEVKAANAACVDENLYVVFGNRLTSKLDNHIHWDENYNKLTNKPIEFTGRLLNALYATGENYSADFILLDLSPTNGILNNRLIVQSDYLLTPLMADYFGFHTISHLNRDLIEWTRDNQNHVDLSKLSTFNQYPKEKGEEVKFLGIIINNFTPLTAKNHVIYGASYTDGVSDISFRQNQNHWFQEIVAESKNIEKFSIKQSAKYGNVIGKVRNYMGLQDISSMFFCPVQFLNDQHAYKSCSNIENSDEKFVKKVE
jgi:cellulose biosynthesis protein BcsQ